MKQKANVTVQDIADRCGLARGTVSMALRDDQRIAEKTRARVHAAAIEMGYDPSTNVAARRLSLARHGRQVHNRVVAMAMGPAFMNATYFRKLSEGAYERLYEDKYAMLLVSPDTDIERLEPLTRGEIDGLICAGTPTIIDEVRGLRQRAGFGDRPMVSLIHPSAGVPSVLADDASGTRVAAHRLLALGHRYVLRIQAGPGTPPNGIPRREAMAGVLVDAGLPIDTHFPTWNSPWPWMDPSAASERLAGSPVDGDSDVIAYLAAHPEITAIACNNDAIAIHAWCALRDAGLDVPGRYSLIGFDDTDPITGPDHRNILSTIRIPLYEIGRRGADIVLKGIAEEQHQPQTVILPTTFIERASIGPAYVA